jgi:hypothetical protein
MSRRNERYDQQHEKYDQESFYHGSIILTTRINMMSGIHVKISANTRFHGGESPIDVLNPASVLTNSSHDIESVRISPALYHVNPNTVHNVLLSTIRGVDDIFIVSPVVKFPR